MKITASVIVLLLMNSGSALAQTDDGAPPVLSVQGTAQVRIAPDQALVRLGIVEQKSTAADAQQGVGQVASAILDAIRGLGIEDSQVQTSRLTLSPIYTRQNPGNSEPARIIAYRASNTVSVRVGDLDLVGEVIDAGLDAGANQLEGISFSLRDDLPARQEALREAVAEARAKAETIADALGVDLAAIVSVTEGNVFVQQPVMEMAALGRGVALQGAAVTPVSPGEVSVNATVSIQYRIE